MSRNPGIGAGAVAAISRALQGLPGDSLVAGTGKTIHIDGKDFPLGRYLIDKLRIVSDVPTGIAEYEESLRATWRDAQRKGVPFLEYLVESDAQRYRNLESKQKLFNSRSDL